MTKTSAFILGIALTLSACHSMADGYAETISQGEISGWACDPSAPNSPADIFVVRDDGVPVVSLKTNILRENAVKAACGSNLYAHHGFSYTPNLLQVAVVGHGDLSQWHWVHVYVRHADGSFEELNNSPKRAYFGFGIPTEGPP